MKRIWKYPIPIRDTFSLLMPDGAEVLTVQYQHGQGCMWAMVDDERAQVRREFSVKGTGHPILEPAHTLKYVGTWQDVELGGALVWHLFERVEVSNWGAEVDHAESRV